MAPEELAAAELATVCGFSIAEEAESKDDAPDCEPAATAKGLGVQPKGPGCAGFTWERIVETRE